MRAWPRTRGEIAADIGTMSRRLRAEAALSSLEPIDQPVAVQERAQEAISESEAFLAEDELGYAALSDSLRTRNVGHSLATEDRFEGDLRADAETILSETHSDHLASLEHFECIGRVSDSPPDRNTDPKS